MSPTTKNIVIDNSQRNFGSQAVPKALKPPALQKCYLHTDSNFLKLNPQLTCLIPREESQLLQFRSYYSCPMVDTGWKRASASALFLESQHSCYIPPFSQVSFTTSIQSTYFSCFRPSKPLQHSTIPTKSFDLCIVHFQQPKPQFQLSPISLTDTTENIIPLFSFMENQTNVIFAPLLSYQPLPLSLTMNFNNNNNNNNNKLTPNRKESAFKDSPPSKPNPTTLPVHDFLQHYGPHLEFGNIHTSRWLLTCNGTCQDIEHVWNNLAVPQIGHLGRDADGQILDDVYTLDISLGSRHKLQTLFSNPNDSLISDLFEIGSFHDKVMSYHKIMLEFDSEQLFVSNVEATTKVVPEYAFRFLYECCYLIQTPSISLYTGTTSTPTPISFLLQPCNITFASPTHPMDDQASTILGYIYGLPPYMMDAKSQTRLMFHLSLIDIFGASTLGQWDVLWELFPPNAPHMSTEWLLVLYGTPLCRASLHLLMKALTDNPVVVVNAQIHCVLHGIPFLMSITHDNSPVKTGLRYYSGITPQLLKSPSCNYRLPAYDKLWISTDITGVPLVYLWQIITLCTPHVYIMWMGLTDNHLATSNKNRQSLYRSRYMFIVPKKHTVDLQVLLSSEHVHTLLGYGPLQIESSSQAPKQILDATIKALTLATTLAQFPPLAAWEFTACPTPTHHVETNVSTITNISSTVSLPSLPTPSFRLEGRYRESRAKFHPLTTTTSARHLPPPDTRTKSPDRSKRPISEVSSSPSSRSPHVRTSTHSTTTDHQLLDAFFQLSSYSETAEPTFLPINFTAIDTQHALPFVTSILSSSVHGIPILSNNSLLLLLHQRLHHKSLPTQSSSPSLVDLFTFRDISLRTDPTDVQSMDLDSTQVDTFSNNN